MRRVLAPLLLAVLVLAGCGNDKATPPTNTNPSPAFGFVDTSFADQGLFFQRPKQWRYVPGTPPLLATISSGLTTIAVWRYPRTEPLPITEGQLATARKCLVAAAKARDASFKVIKAKGTRAAHHPAVVIIADETVGGQSRRVRSTHIYGNGSEYVFDAFAPADQYAKVEDPIFRVVVRSATISKPAG